MGSLLRLYYKPGALLLCQKPINKKCMKSLSITFLGVLFSIAAHVITPITGPSTLCQYQSVTLADATPGGVWSSSAPSIATVGSATGIVTGATPGVTIITYATGSGS